MGKKVLFFTFLAIFAKLIAFAKELLIAYCYGTTSVSDVYLLSMTLPITLFGFVSVGIVSGYIPLYSKVKSQNGSREANIFTNNILNIFLIICLAVVCVYFIFSDELLRIMASGFSDEMIDMAIKFTNISIWAILFACVVSVYTAFLQANGRLNVTAVVSVPLNIGIAVSILVAYKMQDVSFLPIGFLMAAIIQMLFMMIFVLKNGFRHQILIHIHHKETLVFFKSIAVLTVSSSIQQINILIDRTLASGVVVGGLSVFEYGSRINDLIMGLTIIPISTALFPEMVSRIGKNDEFKSCIKDGIKMFLLILVPVSAIAMLYSTDIVKIVYFRGAFNLQSLQLTTQIVFFYAIGLLAFALREILSKAFFAVSDVKTPMINSAIGVGVNITLNFILLRYMGIGGLALATSIAAAVTVVLLYIPLHKKFGSLFDRKMVKIIIAVGCAALLAGVVSKTVYVVVEKIFFDLVWQFIVSACMYFFVYGFALVCMKVVEPQVFIQKARSFTKRNGEK